MKNKEIDSMLLPKFMVTEPCHHGILRSKYNDRMIINGGEFSFEFWFPHELYILDRSITPKEGDWCMYKIETQGVNYEPLMYNPIHGTSCAKIVASSDPTITGNGVLIIPMDFLRMYVTTQGKGKIYIEAELNEDCWDCHNFGDPWDDHHYDNYNKTDDNEAILHITEDGLIWDEIALGQPKPNILGAPEHVCKFSEVDMLNALREGGFSQNRAIEWLKIYMHGNNMS